MHKKEEKMQKDSMGKSSSAVFFPDAHLTLERLDAPALPSPLVIIVDTKEASGSPALASPKVSQGTLSHHSLLSGSPKINNWINSPGSPRYVRPRPTSQLKVSLFTKEEYDDSDLTGSDREEVEPHKQSTQVQLKK